MIIRMEQGALTRASGSPFGTGIRLNILGLSHTLAAGDLDGDGNLDLIVAASAPLQPDISSIPSAFLPGDGSGRLAPAPWSPITLSSNTNAAVIDDFNGDGRADVAFANRRDVNILLGGAGLSITESRPEPLAVGKAGTIRLVLTNGLPDRSRAK